jgi:hypothetical protein
MGRKKRGKSKTTSGNEFLVSDTSTVLQKCENHLKKALNKRSLKFVPESSSSSSEKCIFALLATDLTASFAVNDRDRRHHVVPLLAVGSDTYWLNLTLTFLSKTVQPKRGNTQKEFQFSGASIRIFKGLATEYKRSHYFVQSGIS